MLKNVSKKDLEKRLVESNVKLIESGNNSTLYRDDENHRLVTVEYNSGSFNPYTDWSRFWNIVTDYSDINTFDSVNDLIQEFTDTCDANDDYLYDQLYNQPFSKTQKYLERLGYIVVPLDCSYFGYDYTFSIDESDPTLENVHLVAYVSKDSLKNEYDSKIVTKHVMKSGLFYLESSLKIYSDYVNGKVYSIQVFDTFENDLVDALSDIYFTDDFYDQVRDVYEYLQDMLNGIQVNFDDLKAQMKKYDQENPKNVYLPF